MSNLSTLNLVHTQPAPSDDVWRGLQRSNKSLQSISWTGLYAGNDPSECSRVFWGTCSLMKIKCLNLRNIVLDSQAFDGLSFPSLRELKLRLQQRESIADELQLISQCPALVELSWHPGDWFSRFPSADIKALLLPSTNWPSLRSMDFGGADMKDQDIAATLNSMTDASQLRFRRSRFGQGAFMALRNHFSTLVQLNISHCLAVSSGMMQEVLSSCPLLESFCTGLILSKEIVEGKPWVCLGLKTLAISISIIGRGIPPSGKMELLPLGTKRGRDDENKSIETAIAFHNATVLDQLARLHQLKHLSLSVLDRKMTGYRKVNLRLSGGLDKLSALTNLQHLSVELAQAEVLEKVEIEWISPKVLIVGAGMGGLTLGLLLERIGVDFEIFERASCVKPLGAAMSIGPNILPMFEQLGMLDEIMKLSLAGKMMEVYSEDMTLIGRTDNTAFMKERSGYSPIMFSRPDLHRLLLSKISAKKVHYNKRVLSVGQSDNGVLLRCTDGCTHEGDILIGADGAYSAVRQSLYERLQKEELLPKSDTMSLSVGYTCVVGTTVPQDPEKYPILKDDHAHFAVVVADGKPHS
ncbi:hypothetical protein BGX26_012533, partial [Mortierella sp. AD094]